MGIQPKIALWQMNSLLVRYGNHGWGAALRDYLQDNLGATANTLLAARQAIRHIVEAYANADATAKKRLLAEWRNGPPSWKPSEKAPPGPPPTVVDSYIRRAAENP